MRNLRGKIIVRNVACSDAAVWEAMRRELWPDGAEHHARQIAMFFAGSLAAPIAVLVAESVPGPIVGFVELSIRTDVVGLEGKRVGYVEGRRRTLCGYRNARSWHRQNTASGVT
jgi:aminoglycoside 6'-N-acetyltransferase I